MRFAPEYVTCVLNENFEDAKAQFLAPLMRIHYAHLVMLREQGIVSPADATAIRVALDAISMEEVRRVVYDGTYEDLFFYVEGLIVAACGAEAAGRLHTARSRNDIDMTMYRMQQRGLVLSVLERSLRLRHVLLGLAGQHLESVFAAHTHTQPAQPSTVAHYLLAVVEQLERDAARLKAAFASTNRNPLGACAITGTGFPIDRARTTALLGFDGTSGNTYGSIATVDYLLESASATAVLLTGLGRVLQDLLLWCTSEFGYLRLDDGFVQCSSIMPQKRNPVALEHARAIASKAVGEAHAIFTVVHNTPFGDIVDTEDDLQPLVLAMFRDAVRTVGLVAAAMSTARFDVRRLAEHAGQSWITVTELADTLARQHGVPFRQSHEITTALVQEATLRPAEPIAQVLAEVSLRVLGKSVELAAAELQELLSPQHFVRVRKTPGGPAPAETAGACEACLALLASDQEWLSGTIARLQDAETRLTVAAKEL